MYRMYEEGIPSLGDPILVLCVRFTFTLTSRSYILALNFASFQILMTFHVEEIRIFPSPKGERGASGHQ